MTTVTAPTRSAFSSPPITETRGGLRLTGTTQRRPWQVGLGIALVLVCAAIAGAVFQSSAKRVSVVIATKTLPAGTVLTPRDLGTASIPASGNITAMSATGSSVLVGQQLDTAVYAGQVMVKQMLSVGPQLASGDQVVGMLMKGDQMPSVPLVAGDTVQVIAVPQPGQGSTVGGAIGSTLVASATVFAVGPAPIDQSQYQASVSLEVPGADASTVTSYAAADQIGLALISEGGTVTVVALASVKGAPGVTTAATALAAAWPAGRQVLLVEADPFGGDLAARYGSTVTGGLASLFAAARRTLTPDAVWAHVQPLPGGLPVLFGLTGVRQAVANENAWPVVVEALARLDADVVVDAGRLLPGFAGGIGAVLEVADVLVVLSESTLEAIVHLRDSLPGILAQMGGRRLLVVPTGSDGYPAADIARTLEVTVGPALPDDPAAAAALGNRRSVKRLERTRLLRWAAALVTELGIDAVPSTAPAATDAVRGELPPGVGFDEPLPAIDELMARPPELSSAERSPVGAGSKWEARP